MANRNFSQNVILGSWRVAILLTVLVCSSFAQSSPAIAAAKLYVDQHGADVLRDFAQFLSMPDVARDTPAMRADIDKNATAIKAKLEQRGVTVQILNVENGFPAVYGEINLPHATRTVGIYAHYDGQPVENQKWATAPFEPVLFKGTFDSGAARVPFADLTSPLPTESSEWRIYGRAASDDKGTIQAIFTALDAMKAAGLAPSINIKFLFEGEEEQGSPHLPALMDKYSSLLKADTWLLCDGPRYQNGGVQLVYGARGVMGLEMTLYGPKRALHSGHYGNWAPNPAVEIAHLISAMRDENGHILIPGFYDSARKVTAEERAALDSMPDMDDPLAKELALGRREGDGKKLKELILQPALNVRGIRAGNVGTAATNSIMTEANASIDFRLVPDQSPQTVRGPVEKFLTSLGYFIVHSTPDDATRRAHAKLILLQWDDGYPAARTRLDSPAAASVARALEIFTGKGKLIRTPTLGGSIPMYLFQQKLNAETMILPIANYDNNQHSANENMRLQNLWDGVAIYTVLFTELGK